MSGGAGSGGAGGNLYLLATQADKGMRAALSDRTRVFYSVQHRHPDGKRWLDVGHFATRDIAKLALRAFVADGHGEEKDFRVKKVTIARKPA
jgi:hypothetical protein